MILGRVYRCTSCCHLNAFYSQKCIPAVGNYCLALKKPGVTAFACCLQPLKPGLDAAEHVGETWLVSGVALAWTPSLKSGWDFSPRQINSGVGGEGPREGGGVQATVNRSSRMHAIGLHAILLPSSRASQSKYSLVLENSSACRCVSWGEEEGRGAMKSC